MSEEYSTQIDDLPDDVSDISYKDATIEKIQNVKKTQPLRYEESLLMDSSVLFMIMMMVTNKSFVKWISQYNTKGHIVLSLILSIICTITFVIYKLLLML